MSFKTQQDLISLLHKLGEIPTKSVPKYLAGIIPSLARKGLVEVFKKRTSFLSTKKVKVIRATDARICTICHSVMAKRDNWVCLECVRRALNRKKRAELAAEIQKEANEKIISMRRWE